MGADSKSTEEHTPRHDKDAGPAVPPSSKAVDKDASIPQRLLKSTTGLASSLLSDPGTATLKNREGQRSTKGYDSAPSSSRSGPSSSQETVFGGVGSARHGGIVGEGHSTETEPEAAFGRFLDQPTQDSITEVEGKGKRAVYSQNRERTVEEQGQLDGQDVVALLSGGEESLCFPDSVDFGLGFSEAPRLRAALFGDEGSTALSWDHLLNFWPLEDPSLYPDFVSRSPKKLDSHADSTPWFHQWKNVLTRYSDEVWGELAPEVEKARAEVDAVETLQTPDPEKGLASLRRLQHILSHLRGL